MLGITSMIPTRCEGPDYSLCFYSSSQLSRYLLSLVQFTTLSAPCVIKYKHSEPTTVVRARRYFSCVCFMISSFTYPNMMADTPFFHWCLYYIQPHAPVTSAETFQLCCFQCSPWQENNPVSSPYFPNAVHERQLHKTAIHSRDTGVLHLKRPQHITASEV